MSDDPTLLDAAPPAGAQTSKAEPQRPVAVKRDVLRSIIEQLGFKPTDVAAFRAYPTLLEVDLYRRDPEHGNRIATRPGGHAVIETVEIGVVG